MPVIVTTQKPAQCGLFCACQVSRGRRGCSALTAAGVPLSLAKDDFPTGFPLIPKLAYKKVEIKAK